MKINFEKTNDRKIVAVIGENGAGVFLPTRDGKYVYIDKEGFAVTGNLTAPKSDFEELSRNNKRTPIFEGDKIVLEF